MRWFRARAKVNLTLRVLGLRADGYHELESLVAFGGVCDWLGYEPGAQLTLEIDGPNAGATGPAGDNLVLRAAHELSGRVADLKLGRFRLIKILPAAAGLGGGSSDAAAALRALADRNGLALDDDRVKAAAVATGADVPVCLAPQARLMTGVGEKIGPSVPFGDGFALLANPRIPTATRDVFKAFDRAAGDGASARPAASWDRDTPIKIESLAAASNDLEAAAIEVSPGIRDVLETLGRLPGARLTRMSGSGATCFALFDTRESAAAGRLKILAERPDWWIAATRLR
jgi:4-diphosphocytidyl-2-C-methyl-D-erythritol kinase